MEDSYNPFSKTLYTRAHTHTPALIFRNDGLMSSLLTLSRFHLSGMGDSYVPFSKLAERMNLPQTACLSLLAPWSLPFDMGRAWITRFRPDGLGRCAVFGERSVGKKNKSKSTRTL